jgi:hypothetical protein
MKTVFVDTSGFYACLDGTDPFHSRAVSAFERAEKEPWKLITNYHELHRPRNLGAGATPPRLGRGGNFSQRPAPALLC